MIAADWPNIIGAIFGGLVLLATTIIGGWVKIHVGKTNGSGSLAVMVGRIDERTRNMETRQRLHVRSVALEFAEVRTEMASMRSGASVQAGVVKQHLTDRADAVKEHLDEREALDDGRWSDLGGDAA